MVDIKTHTIMFWVDPSKAGEIHKKAYEAIEEYKEHIRFDAVVPYLVKAQSSAPTANEGKKHG